MTKKTPFEIGGKPVVSLAKCHSYEKNELSRAVEEVLVPFGGMGALIRPGDRVLIKLNLLMPATPEQGITTHPQMAEILAKRILDYGGKPVFADSGAVRNWDRLVDRTGIAEMAARIAVPLVNLDKMPAVLTNSDRFPGLEISSILREVDHIIGLAKLKTHTQMHYTSAVKHYFGLVPGERKQEWHFKVGRDYMAFARLLVEIYTLVNPLLTIVDGVLAMEGDGPGAGGILRPLGALFAGQNCRAIDLVVTEVIGADPRFSFTQLASRERFPLPQGISDIHLHNPDLLEKIRKNDWVFPEVAPMMIGPKPLRPLIRRHLTLFPKADPRQCTLCLACKKICPAGSIREADDRIKVDRESCIRCFCCVEVCPSGAIGSRAPLARKLLESVLPSRIGRREVGRQHVSYSKGAPGLKDSLHYAYHIVRANLYKEYRIPLSIYFFLTYRCTLDCKYCNVRNGSPQPPELETEVILQLLDEMARAGVRKIQFTGGEPLLHKDIGQIILRAKKNGLFVGISSNGDLVPSRIEALKPVDVVFISLDGPGEIHDSFRGVGSQQRALAACHCLKKEGINVWTTSVIHRQNIGHLEYPLQLARENGWVANFQLLHGRRPDSSDNSKQEDLLRETMLTDQENRQALDYLIQQKQAGAPIGQSLRFLTTLRHWGDYGRLVKAGSPGKCWAGKLYAYIEPDGFMYPCGTQVHRGKPVNVSNPGGFVQAWTELDRSYGCSQCLSGCQMEQNMMFSLDPGVLMNWYTVLRRSARDRR